MSGDKPAPVGRWPRWARDATVLERVGDYIVAHRFGDEPAMWAVRLRRKAVPGESLSPVPPRLLL